MDNNLELQEFELDEIGNEFQPHRVDDPDVWGLRDVVRGRTPLVPTTIYATAGDSTSGVVGLLFPNGQFLVKSSSKVGTELVYQDGGADDGQKLPKGRVLPTSKILINAALPTIGVLVTAWDGAAQQDEFIVTDEDGNTELRREHSRGLLLGDYSVKNQVDRGPKRVPSQERRERNRAKHSFYRTGVAQAFPSPQIGNRCDLEDAA